MSLRVLIFSFSAFLVCLLNGCGNQNKPLQSTQVENAKGEYIHRRHDEHSFRLEKPQLVKRDRYPWEESINGTYTKITKEFFRCKGSLLNPVRFYQKGEELQRFYDCGGAQRHSLPLRNQKEFIYPILIDLLNFIQTQTGKRVVITSGHSCPDHNTYLDPSPINQASKHMLGAEVDFYVQDVEQQPELIVNLILNYYQQNSKYKGIKDFEEFKRYEKTTLTIMPWYNKEIFVKILKKHEGRDFDNRHPYPYVSVQVRYDCDLQEPVHYTWDKAFRNFLRW